MGGDSVGQETRTWQCVVKYSNGSEIAIKKSEEPEFRATIVADQLLEWQHVVEKVRPAFDYLESRLEDTCDAPYHMKLQHFRMRILQVFDPSMAVGFLDESLLSSFTEIPAFVCHKLIPDLQKEMRAYLTHASGFKLKSEPCGNNDSEYQKEILTFWASKHAKFPTWGIAARIAFALSPNSAACERVFSMLKLFFGEQRDATLADQIEVALMLAYNGREVG